MSRDHNEFKIPSLCFARSPELRIRCVNLEKESIQPQVPLRLPCYDFTSVTPNTVTPSTDSSIRYRTSSGVKINNLEEG